MIEFYKTFEERRRELLALESVVARQVVGVLARRVVCRLAAGGDVRAGERYGVMKFGSRMDVTLGPEWNVQVRAGQRVVAGISILATLGEAK